MKNTQPDVLPQQEKKAQEIELQFADINKQLILTTFEGIAVDQPAYSKRIHSDDIPFLELQHELLDLYPAILNVQIRDLFTPNGKTKGRFRMRQLGEVYRTLAHLLSAAALANLWDVVADKENYPTFKIKPKERDVIKAYIYCSGSIEEGCSVGRRKVDHFQLLSTICSVFEYNKTGLYVKELSNFNQVLHQASPAYAAHQFFEHECCPRVEKQPVPDKDVPAFCQLAEQHLGQLLKATAFLCNYEIIRIKDVTVNYTDRSATPTFVHDKILVSGREYPTVDPIPVASQNTYHNHSIFLSKGIEVDGLSLNLSPFIVDQNAFKGRRHYLPKVYFFAGIDQGKKSHFIHVDTPALDFVLEKNKEFDTYAYLKQLNEQVAVFCKAIGL